LGTLLVGAIFMLLPFVGNLTLYPALMACGAFIAIANGVFPVYMVAYV
jgi:hypothetical protein